MTLTKTSGTSDARTASTTGLSTTAKAALASILGDTTLSASAANPVPSEPQHPPCDVSHHLTGQGCGWMPCPVCGEEYSLGQKISRGNFHFWPDGEYAYWAHVGASEKHQYILDIQAISQRQLLDSVPDVLPAARKHQKLMLNPAYQGLRKLFR